MARITGTPEEVGGFRVGDRVKSNQPGNEYIGEIASFERGVYGGVYALVKREDSPIPWYCTIKDGKIATAAGSWDGRSFLKKIEGRAPMTSPDYRAILQTPYAYPLAPPVRTTAPKKKKPAKKPFKKGDKVKLRSYDGFSDYKDHDGQTATIVGETKDDDLGWSVVWSDGRTSNVSAKNLVIAPPEKPTPKVAISSVVLDKKKIEEIRAAISQIENTEKIFAEWGFDEVFEKGTAISMLFWGIPGTGKTLMAQAIADELDADLKIIGTAEVQSSEPGGAERALKKFFAEAHKRNTTPGERKMVLLFDECDSLLMDRNRIGVILAAEVNTLLSEIERYKGIVIFTTNRLGKLDPALERRIAAKVEFEFPDKQAREKIWERMIPKKAPIDKDVNFKDLAEFPLVGGNIKNAVLNAARDAAYRGLKYINRECFVRAIEKEVKAIQAFIAEYDNEGFNGIASGISREPGSLVVDRTQVKEKIKPKVSALWKEGKK